MELDEGRRFLLAQQQSPTQRACHLLTYLRTNLIIGILVVGAISAIFWATKYSQDNKEVPAMSSFNPGVYCGRRWVVLLWR
jgi:hypothetical protein